MLKGKIYVIQSGDTHYYKIGLGKDPYSQRIHQLQTGNPYRLYLRLAHDVVDMELAEDIVHRRYYQLRGLGEWFLFDPDHYIHPARIDEALAYINTQLDQEIEFRIRLYKDCVNDA